MKRPLAIAALGLALFATACTKPVDHTCDGAAPVVGTELLAFLSLARAAHHEADVYEEQNALPKAIAALERINTAPHEANAPEAREVIADTDARLAELRVQVGDFDGATKDVAAGKELATEPTYFRGHLFEVEGLIEAKRAAALTKAGNAAEAEKARERSITASDAATKILSDVVHRAMDQKTP